MAHLSLLLQGAWEHQPFTCMSKVKCLHKLWFVSYCLQQYLVVSITANAGYVSQVSQTEKTGEDGKGKYLGHLYLSSIQQKTLYMIEFLGITKDNICTIVTKKKKNSIEKQLDYEETNK